MVITKSLNIDRGKNFSVHVISRVLSWLLNAYCVPSITPKQWGKPWAFKKFSVSASTSVTFFGSLISSGTRCLKLLNLFTLLKNFSYHVFVRSCNIQHDLTIQLRFLFSNNLFLFILDVNDAKIWHLREICALHFKSIWNIWRPWSCQSDPNKSKFRNASIFQICRSKTHDCYSWFEIKTSDNDTHIRHENQVSFSKFFFWKSCSKQKLEIVIFINILRLKVLSWTNLKILRRLLFMISKSHISFKAITFLTVYITKLWVIQNKYGKK